MATEAPTATVVIVEEDIYSLQKNTKTRMIIMKYSLLDLKKWQRFLHEVFTGVYHNDKLTHY